jgi:two-component system, LytTR family, response regulator
MLSNYHTPVIPINDYVALQTELAMLKAQYEALQAQVDQKQHATAPTIYVKDQGITKIISLSDIIMMQADSNYTTIHLTDGDKILTSKTLKYWSEKIKSHADFIRPHRSYLVNKTHILSYQTSTHRLLLAQGQEIQVSRRYKFL